MSQLSIGLALLLLFFALALPPSRSDTSAARADRAGILVSASTTNAQPR
jgi:hypothetical protein